MADGKTWEDHYKSLGPEDLSAQREALKTLRGDQFLFDEFRSTGLFSLEYFILDELMKRD